MICEIRFLAKGKKFDTTAAKVEWEGDSLSGALRYAASVLDKPSEKKGDINAVRVRVK